jgi:hypothetical protein
MSRLILGARLVVLPGNHGALIGESGTAKGSKLPMITATLVEEFLND